MNDFAISASGLSTHALRNANLHLGIEERVAILGTSGSGKSLLLSCLLGLVRPTAGEVTVLGQRVGVRPVSPSALGVAFQNPGVFEAWDVRRNLLIALNDPLDDRDLRSLLDHFGLQNVDLSSATNRLSGGQKKRLSLLRATLRGTRLLILDEPLSGLDPHSADIVIGQLEQMLIKSPRAVLVITHRHDLALRLCDRVLFLVDGALVNVTPPADAPDREAQLRRRVNIGSIRETVQPSLRQPLAWGVAPQIIEFITRGAPVSMLAMALLGGLFVVQSKSGAGQIDISGYVPKLVTLSICREIAPLVVGLLLAGRIGARISAEIGGMKYTAQLDSMRVMGLSPGRRLLLPFATSASIAIPICVAIGAATGVLSGALAVAIPGVHLTIGTRRFLNLAMDSLSAPLAISIVLKGFVMGLLVSTASFMVSSRRVESAQELGTVVTRSTALGAFLVVLTDVLISWIFFA